MVYNPRKQGYKDAIDGKPVTNHRSTWNQSQYNQGYVEGGLKRLEIEIQKDDVDPNATSDELDEDDRLWLVNEQIKSLLEGDGAGEDHEAVLFFLTTTGLPRRTVGRIHKALCCAEKKQTGKRLPETPTSELFKAFRDGWNDRLPFFESFKKAYASMYMVLVDVREDKPNLTVEERFEKLLRENDRNIAIRDTPESLLRTFFNGGIEVNARDAERYQEVRSWHWNSSSQCVVQEPKKAVLLRSVCPFEAQLDVIVDECIERRKK